MFLSSFLDLYILQKTSIYLHKKPQYICTKNLNSCYNIAMGKYINRISDAILEKYLRAFGGVLIEGVKGCGKTTSAKQIARSFIEFQDEEKREMYLALAKDHPSELLKGDRPRLFDEWQDAPTIWGAIRKSIDDEQLIGAYILTGSSSGKVKTPHTGTMRIARMKMYPMSLYESGDSNGSVSLIDLFEGKTPFEGCKSDLSFEDIKYVVCRGGWPNTLNVKNKKDKLLVAESLFNQTCEIDIHNISSKRRNENTTRKILRSYARNICTIAKKKTIYEDSGISENTFNDYLEDLEKLNIICDVNAWCPAIRSKEAMRSSPKRNLVDPSIACAALGIGPDYFINDYQILGFLFESLCIRDLKIYSSLYGGEVSYYHDRYGLEADAVLHLKDGRFALIEIKLGQSEIDEGAKHLTEIESLIKQHNETEKQNKLRLPDLKIVITGTEYGYQREDGVYVIPLGCLKD